MPYSSGTYSLPSGNPVVTGTTISSSTTNTTNSDIATALSTCVLKDGTQTITANLPMASHKLTGLSAGTTAGDSVEYGGSPTFTNVTATNVTAASVTTTGATGSLNSINTFGFKNRIINGNMVIDQRNAGASVTPTVSASYNLDRWQVGITVASKFSVQQNAGSVTPPVGFTKYLGCTSLSAYSVLTGDTLRIQQPVEGFNIADLAWGTANAATVTLSFWVRSSLTGTFGGSIFNSAATRSYPFSYSIPIANTWTSISITIVGETTGVWATDNTQGLNLSLSLGTGATYSATAGAWANGLYTSATGAVSVVGTSGATFYITGVQLEKGSVATSFDQRAYSQELAMCQRYCQPVTGTSYTGQGFGAGGQRMSHKFIQTMRATPTLNTSYPSAVLSGFAVSDGDGNINTQSALGIGSLVANKEICIFNVSNLTTLSGRSYVPVNGPGALAEAEL